MGIYIIFFIVLLVTISVLTGTGDEVPAMSYTDVRKAIQGGEVTELIIGENAVLLTLQDESQMVYEVTDMNFFMEDLGDEIEAQQEAGTLVVDYEVQHYSIWYSMLPYLIIIVVMGAFWMFMMNRQGGGGGNAMNFGKSRAKLANPNDQKKVTFQDVAGADEEKADLEEIVDFLKEPKKYMALGARIPKGVLLVGPPGTGKTLIAKAVAGEAGVPFFSISGSDFVELYVGVGASRVRDLFDQAKKHAPAIVFIDEIDAVGRQRGAGLGGGHDEREQTLNQLLVEMDGFGNNAGVIVMAATNRADILDPALLRPGRFDRQIYIGVPDIKGRVEILKVHARKKPFEDDVSFDAIARSTVGFTGADLENLLNEAALLAAREGKSKIGLKDIDNAFLKVIMGNEKKNRVITEHERRITAYHEAGHALTSRVLPTQDPVQQVSIVPRGRAGGFTLNMPKEDKYYNTKQQMEEELIVLLGGRVAEKLIMDDISTGASNDIQRATDIARKMVTKYGMSEKIGPIDFSSTQSEVFLGRDFANTNQLSEQTASLIDSEVKALIHTAYERCEQILRDNMEILHRLAQFLLDNETMDNGQLEAIYKGEEPPAASAKSLGQKEEGDLSAKEAMQAYEAQQQARAAREAAEKAAQAVEALQNEEKPQE
ncbi:MAG: ATP-dependent zinc metalloprotease FtsH [Clostridia bacterium]|nr:ATP-dependent zinc metalloprotease FtsH [Clostridia bacterium]